MTNIIKKEQGDLSVNDNGKWVFSPSAPVTIKDRELFLASRNFPQIRTIEDKNEVIKPIHEYINQAIADRGFKYEKDEIKYLKTRVADDIMRDFGGYTLEEIRLAFHYGVREEFGEYMGLNPVTFFNWLKAYRESLIPPINKAIQPLLPKPQEVIPTQYETDLTSIEIVTDVYTKLVEKNEYNFYDVGNVIFKFLSRIGVLSLTEEEIAELRYESAEHFKTSITKRNHELVSKQKSIQSIDLDRAFKQIEEESNPQFEHQIQVGIMRLALFQFFTKCAKEEVDLISVINEQFNTTYPNGSEK